LSGEQVLNQVAAGRKVWPDSAADCDPQSWTSPDPAARAGLDGDLRHRRRSSNGAARPARASGRAPAPAHRPHL